MPGISPIEIDEFTVTEVNSNTNIPDPPLASNYNNHSEYNRAVRIYEREFGPIIKSRKAEFSSCNQLKEFVKILKSNIKNNINNSKSENKMTELNTIEKYFDDNTIDYSIDEYFV